MKAPYTSDLHGEIHLYQELFSLALSSSAELLAMGGDLREVDPSEDLSKTRNLS
jgi:Icc-related predicted phosphoesterase